MNIGVIFAGGMGSRMKSRDALPKQFLEVHGTPLIVHTLRHFQEHPAIDGIVVAILPEWQVQFARLLGRFELNKVKWVVDGGETGHESRHRALEAVAEECPGDSVVLIHDGVRPLINGELIDANIETVLTKGPAVTCTKVNETVISSQNDCVDVVFTRDHLYVAQAPQSLRLDDAIVIYDRARFEGDTNAIDTCSLLKKYDYPIFRVDGPVSNIKITTAEDYYVCRAFFDVLESRQVGI